MNEEEEEIWRPVPGSNCVEASNLGRIRQFGRVLEQRGYQYPYLYVINTHNWGKLTKRVHRLVCLAFHPNPENKPMVNHKDENTHNNRADNLMWATNGENQIWGTCPERKSKALKGNTNALGYRHPEEVKQQMRHPKSKETKLRMSASLKGNKNGVGNKSIKGRIWANNGVVNKVLKPDEPMPVGFMRGRLKKV